MKTCPKCGGKWIHMDWHRGCQTNRCEHLHYCCTCGYEKTGPTKDAKESPHD